LKACWAELTFDFLTIGTMMKNLIFTCLMAGTLAACGTMSMQSPTQVTQSKVSTMSKKPIVGEFLGAVTETTQREKIDTFFAAVNAKNVPLFESVVWDGFIQHNPYVPTGRAGIVGLFPTLDAAGTTVNNIRVIEDGNFVAVHNFWNKATPFGSDQVVTFDVFRFDGNGKVAEHWDAMMAQTPPNPSGRTLTDGATAVTDFDKTEAHKAQVKRLFDALIHGTPEQAGAAVQANFAPDYKQHNPMAADGLKGFMAAMPTEQWAFKKQHKVLGEGNFVLSVSEGTRKGKPVVFYDLLRFESGKIVEHWDVIQDIPTQGLANNNGMFGFK
jgi:predicted SnoaL-like aldol condensation-catalyzing enzyme